MSYSVYLQLSFPCGDRPGVRRIAAEYLASHAGEDISTELYALLYLLKGDAPPIFEGGVGDVLAWGGIFNRTDAYKFANEFAPVLLKIYTDLKGTPVPEHRAVLLVQGEDQAASEAIEFSFNHSTRTVAWRSVGTLPIRWI